jgi:catalase
VRVALVAHLRNVDDDLATRVARGLGLEGLPDPAPAARAPVDVPPSPALSIHKKALATLQGRTIGVLIADGSDRRIVDELRTRVQESGATLKTIAPRLAGFSWADGTPAAADAQLAGTPSVLFDAVALVLSKEEADALTAEAAAVDFVRDAHGHLKAIGVAQGALALLETAHIRPDPGVVSLDDLAEFLDAASTRQWAREPHVRTMP